jgi:putative methionine-R-sulfoxide reductase with GAF domain
MANRRAEAARDYGAIADAAAGLRDLPADERLRRFTDIAWDHVARTGVSWLGFYLLAPDAASLILGPCRDKPACSPLDLRGEHVGVCARCWREKRALIVRDVAALGPDYVACDPRDRSEVVVPLLDAAGACSGVLDLDSHDTGSFTERDAAGLHMALLAAGLTAAPHEPALAI